MNPTNSEAIVRQLNNFTSKFKSIEDIWIKLIDEFGDQVPSSLNFTFDYYEGSPQVKIWLCTTND